MAIATGSIRESERVEQVPHQDPGDEVTPTVHSRPRSLRAHDAARPLPRAAPARESGLKIRGAPAGRPGCGRRRGGLSWLFIHPELPPRPNMTMPMALSRG